jgi:GABA permease
VSLNSTTTHRDVLVLVNDVEPSERLVETVRAAVEDGGRVRVVAPALVTRRRYWASDRIGAKAAARHRLLGLLAELERAGISAEGSVGAGDPAQAAADALAAFDADEVIIASGPSGTWHAQGLVRRLQERYAGPILELAASPTTGPVQLDALRGAAA